MRAFFSLCRVSGGNRQGKISAEEISRFRDLWQKNVLILKINGENSIIRCCGLCHMAQAPLFCCWQMEESSILCRDGRIEYENFQAGCIDMV